MQIATDVTALPTADVDQLVADAATAPSGTVIVLTPTEAAALLGQINGVAHQVLANHPLWTVNNQGGGSGDLPMQYPLLRDIYAALGGTDSFTLTGRV